MAAPADGHVVTGDRTGSEELSPPTETHFSEPTKAGGQTTPDYSIQRQLVSLINNTPSGERIRIAIFLLGANDDPEGGIIDALLAAVDRGVHVQVISEDKDDYPGQPLEDFAEELDSRSDPESLVETCTAGCIGTWLNHNKFALFSSTSGNDKVIFQTSANWTRGAAASGPGAHNFALTLRDEPELYDAYSVRWDEMLERADPGYTEVRGRMARAHFLPAEPSQNVIRDLLDRVECPSEGPRTVIRVAVFNINNVAIAEKLTGLDDAGCRVIVVHTDLPGDDDAIDELTQLGPDGGSVVYSYRQVRPYVHSKYMLIDGLVDGAPGKHVVAGSLNYANLGMWSQDETLLHLWDHDDVYAAFVENFNQVVADHDCWSRQVTSQCRPEDR